MFIILNCYPLFQCTLASSPDVFIICHNGKCTTVQVSLHLHPLNENFPSKTQRTASKHSYYDPSAAFACTRLTSPIIHYTSASLYYVVHVKLRHFLLLSISGGLFPPLNLLTALWNLVGSPLKAFMARFGAFHAAQQRGIPIRDGALALGGIDDSRSFYLVLTMRMK